MRVLDSALDGGFSKPLRMDNFVLRSFGVDMHSVLKNYFELAMFAEPDKGAGLGATYGFSAGVFNFTREHRMFEMVGEIETAQLQKALSQIDETYTEFRAEGIGRLEFPIAKRFYKRETKKQLTNTTSVAFTVSNALRNGFDNNYVDNLVDTIDDLSRGDTNKLIGESFPEFDQLLKVVVSPDDKALEGACVISSLDEVADCL